MSYAKKYTISTVPGKNEKCRYPISNVFASECSIDLTPSPSRMSLSSLTYNESHVANDNDSQMSNFSLEELKEKFKELVTKRSCLQNILDQKIKEGIDLNKEEFDLTGKVPLDHQMLDPRNEICFTNNPLPSCLLNIDNQSDYQKEKNRLLLEMKTLSNIYEVLRNQHKPEKKRKKELEKKAKDMQEITDKINDLERERVSELGLLKYRSNSMVNLNRISDKLCETKLSNGNINSEIEQSYDGPLTEPSQRKFKSSDNSTISSSNRNNEAPFTTNDDSARTVSSNPRYRITNLKQLPNGNLLHPNPSYINNSNFQRFSSVRTTIKGPVLSEKFRSSFNKIDKFNIFEDANMSNISSASRSSIDESTGSDISDMQESKKQIELTKTKCGTLRKNSTVCCRSHHCRDSMELNQSRLNHFDSSHSKRIINLSKYNKQKRKSISLEDLSEEVITANVKYLSRKEQKHLEDPGYCSTRNQLIYHPSIRYCTPSNLTMGKQPSIIRKEARNNSSFKMT